MWKNGSEGAEKQGTGAYDMQGEADMMDQDQLNSLIIAELPVALLVVDGEYKIIEFNPAAERVTGMKRQEVLGCSCTGGALLRSLRIPLSAPGEHGDR